MKTGPSKPAKNPRAKSDLSLEIKRVGTSTGIILPKQLLERLRLKQGDRVIATEGPNGTLTLAPYNEDDAEALRIARELMAEYAETFRALAK